MLWGLGMVRNENKIERKSENVCEKSRKEKKTVKIIKKIERT